jgi:hypothetical protein
MTRLSFRLLVLAAASFFIVFCFITSGSGPENASPTRVLAGPNTPPEPSLFIPIVIIVGALGILVSYIGLFFVLRWARVTLFLFSILFLIGQLMVPSHARPSEFSLLHLASLCLPSLAVAMLSFSAGAKLFQPKV